MLPFRIFKVLGDESLHFVQEAETLDEAGNAPEVLQSYGPASTSLKIGKRESACLLLHAAERRIKSLEAAWCEVM
jgi:hypothetical protein